MLLVKKETTEFDMQEIKRGTLICAKHSTWQDWKSGIVTAVKEKLIRVEFPPEEIGCITNHYFIPASEASAGEWQIRYSCDGLNSVKTYPEAADGIE